MMRKEIISTVKAPAAIGPYSQAVKAGNLLFISGQIPLDPRSGAVVGGGAGAQAARILENLGGILHSQGLAFSNVVKTTVFLRDMADFEAVNAVYGGYFSESPPARSTVQVARLPRDVSVEIEAVVVYG